MNESTVQEKLYAGDMATLLDPELPLFFFLHPPTSWWPEVYPLLLIAVARRSMATLDAATADVVMKSLPAMRSQRGRKRRQPAAPCLAWRPGLGYDWHEKEITLPLLRTIRVRCAPDPQLDQALERLTDLAVPVWPSWDDQSFYD